MADIAEDSYRRIIRIHHSFEARYYYGLFLMDNNYKDEARDQFQTLREEIKLLPGYLSMRNFYLAIRSFRLLLKLRWKS